MDNIELTNQDRMSISSNGHLRIRELREEIGLDSERFRITKENLILVHQKGKVQKTNKCRKFADILAKFWGARLRFA